MNIQALMLLAGRTPIFPVDESQPETAAIKQFALSNGFEYYPGNPQLVENVVHDYKTFPAWLGPSSKWIKKDAYHVTTGQYRGFYFTMFLMWDYTTNGTSYENPNEQQKIDYIKQQTTGIVRVSLPKIFPQVVLDSIKNDRYVSSVTTSFDASQSLQLEGDFNDYFDLYAPVGLQVNVLTLLAPNMMQILMDHAGLFDVEFYKNEMILMTKSSLYNPEVMKALDEALTEQLNYLTRLIPSWNYTPKQSPVDTLKRPFFNGATMRIAGHRISPKIQMLVILPGIVVVWILIIMLLKKLE